MFDWAKIRAALSLQYCGSQNPSGVWWQRKQVTLVTVIFFFHTGVEFYTRWDTNTHAHSNLCAHNISMVQCHFPVLRLSEQVYFPPFSAHGQPQCLHQSCVCVWECEFLICRSSDLSALYLHMRTMWLTAMPYLFCLATSLHACTHTRMQKRHETGACTRCPEHAHIFTR